MVRVMALAVSRAGTVLKKCDRSNHKPESNRRCAAGACQHTCDNPERCSHAWTLRYSANGKQVEKSFKDEVNASTGRTSYGSGRKLAQDFQLKLTVDKRSGDKTFADYSKLGRANFGDAVEAYIAHLAVSANSKGKYLSNYRTHIKPVFSHRTISQAADDRDAALNLLTVKMKELSLSVRTITRLLLTGTLDEAVRAGKIAKHRLAGIELADNGTRKNHSDFVFPGYAQVQFVAEGGTNPESKKPLIGAGICVWLMRGCGLRIEEALAVEKSDFKDDGSYLRVMWQASRNGQTKEPLKDRKQGEYRDVPVPSWLWDLVKDMPDAPLMPGNNGRPFQLYNTVYTRFSRAASAAGIPDGFTPHSLRHAFASAMLARGVQITELAHFLGHRNINVTHSIYGHLLPSPAARAKAALDAEYADWSEQRSGSLRGLLALEPVIDITFAPPQGTTDTIGFHSPVFPLGPNRPFGQSEQFTDLPGVKHSVRPAQGPLGRKAVYSRSTHALSP
jgi:site-specific recombinase XerC